MYASVYNVDSLHVATIDKLSEDITKKVYEFDLAQFTGTCLIEINDASYALVYNDEGVKIYSGFIKNIVQDKKKTTFKIDDWRNLFDTEVLLDFSQSTPSHALDSIFTKVMEQIVSTSDNMNTKLAISYTIPTDTTSTIEIADYTHDYIIVNAWTFLKVYLAYHGYYIEADFSATLKAIVFTFIKQIEEKEIRIHDFQFDKKTVSTKTNKTVATIKQKTNEASGDNVWGSSDSTAWDAADANDKSEGSVLPSPVGYAENYLFKLEVLSGGHWETGTITDYNASSNKYTKYINSGTTSCPASAPTFAIMEAEVDINDYPSGTVIRFNYYYIDGDNEGLCTNYGYLKAVATINYTYHIINTTIVFIPRPSYVERIYLLGNDNEIYSGYPDETLRLYPVKGKIFEDEYLSKSQFKAVEELVNSRYNENIYIKDILSPIPLVDVELYTMFKVYNAKQDFIYLPVTERRLVKGELTIKLGFKKQLFTEIIKSKEV